MVFYALLPFGYVKILRNLLNCIHYFIIWNLSFVLWRESQVDQYLILHFVRNTDDNNKGFHVRDQKILANKNVSFSSCGSYCPIAHGHIATQIKKFQSALKHSHLRLQIHSLLAPSALSDTLICRKRNHGIFTTYTVFYFGPYMSSTLNARRKWRRSLHRRWQA